MSNVYYDPVDLSKVHSIKDDVSICYFLRNELTEKDIKIVFDLEENAHLNLTIIDFSNSGFDFKVNCNLKRNSEAHVSVCCINFTDKDKVFEMNATHVEGDSFSRVKMGGINSGSGKLAFLGKSLIVNGSHRSNTRQEGKITNLSADCKSEVSPTLLIKDNDVIASHGAAVGAYNPDHVFYLMSRGLTLEESRKLITLGSLLPIIEDVKDERLLEECKKTLEGLSI